MGKGAQEEGVAMEKGSSLIQKKILLGMFIYGIIFRFKGDLFCATY